MSILVIAETRRERYLLEAPIVPVAEQLLRDRVVCDENVRPAIPVKVVDGNTESFARRSRNPALLRNISEGAIAIVMKYQVCGRVELIGVTVSAVPGLVTT